MNKSLVAFGLATGLAAIAPAQAQTASPAIGPQGQNQVAAINKHMQGRRAVVGQVVDTRVVSVQNAKGQSVQHRLVRLKNKEGKVIVVDLGVASRAPQPRKGAAYVALGKEARINGRPVLFASYAGDVRATGAIMDRKQ